MNLTFYVFRYQKETVGISVQDFLVAHTKEDLDFAVKAFKEVNEEMRI
jgi:hypothetical protein